MKILLVDVGTGTQDIFLYDSRLDLENGFKLVLPSPTMIAHHRIKAATEARVPIALTGHQMGGGPSAWAAEAHARAGLPAYATPEAAKTINDELDKVQAAGVKVISDDELSALPDSVKRIPFRDLDLPAIQAAFSPFGVTLDDLSAIAVAVFDHGDAPPGVSDRQFRFDYLDARIRERNSLSSFAYLSINVPSSMTRLRSVVDSAGRLDCPLLVMDTAPAAILGAGFDAAVARRERKLIVNVGNFHTLAFRLGAGGIEGVFEHHTGEIDLLKLEALIHALADGSLKHEDVFNDMGHGALIYDHTPFEFGKDEFDIVVTGPRRSVFNPEGAGVLPAKSKIVNRKLLRPYFAVPFGDMMLAGCFGLLAAAAEIMPDFAERIRASLRHLRQGGASGVAPWDVK
jgi:uncharacterized protein (DUF1786 family)